MISIEYLQSSQACKIRTDKIDDHWRQIKTHYSQISLQSESFKDSIELPWHLFVANLNILVDFCSLYNIEINFSSQVQALLKEAVRVKQELSKVELEKGLGPEEVQLRLNALGFKRNLTWQQKRNLAKLSRMRYGATFSVPGAGKTTEAIAFFLLHRKAEEKLVVICPKNVFPAWEEQFKICLGEESPKIKRLTNGFERIDSELDAADSDVFLISYQQFIRVVSSVASFFHRTRSFLFIDESHRMKGGDRTDTGRQIQRIAHLPIGKLIMSGTPMPQGETDLLPQYSFLFPNDNMVNEVNVKETIKKVYVRTTKNELLQPEIYPLKIFKTPIAFNEPQQNLYNLIRSEELRQIANLNLADRRVYRKLGRSYMRLLQVVSNPSLLLKTSDSFPDLLRQAIEYGPSNKLTYAALKARQLAKEGKKVLIWSGFTENVESLAQMLSDLGARFIHGGVEAGTDEEENTREEIVKSFHDDPNMFALIANPAACSEGISLHTVCHHAIYVDRNYNAAQFLQSMDRIHRLGLVEHTLTSIEILHTSNSIDDLVDARLTDKVRRMSRILEDPSLNVEAVTVELDDEGFDEEDAKELIKHLKNS